jgi:hypothetical protein
MQDLSSITTGLANLQKQLQQLQQLNSPQALQNYLINNGQLAAPKEEPAPVQPETETSSLSKQQEMLLSMYDEFATTDDGKALAIGLSKFARYVQSKVAKS